MDSMANITVDEVYRSNWGRIVATLIGAFGDFDLAEEAAQEAFAAAVNQWRTTGIPDSPAAWIIQTARHKAIDRLRRRTRFQEKVESYVYELPTTTEQPEIETGEIRDDRLRLVFTCCHPALPEEATGLLALMLLHDSRRDARVNEAGDLVILEEQDRIRWNQRQIAEALPLVEESLRLEPGPYALQAAIAAEHCQAAHAEDTNWSRIVGLYDLLERVQPSPIVSLHRAVAIAMTGETGVALRLIDSLNADLEGYHLLHAARADLLRRQGAASEAAESYERALALVTNESERRFLDRRLREVRAL